jgi:transposase
MKKIAYVGIDYHQSFLAVVVLPEGASQPEDKAKLENDPKKIKKYMKKLSGRFDIQTCYEASSCGYVFYRQMHAWGHVCQVIAPSKIPTKPGDHVKTDFKDAENLAYQLRNGSLSFVHVPQEEEEAVRALVRCRRALKEDSKRVKLRIFALLKTQGCHYQEGSLWTKKHEVWLNTLELPPLVDRTCYEYRTHLEYLNNRIADLDQEIQRLSETGPYVESVRALMSLRGIGTLSAMTLISEIIDFTRFPTAKALMGYLGLTPSEYSSSTSKQYGRITKAGNSACRRILVECVQHYRKKPVPTVTLRKKWKGQPAERVRVAMNCMQRLHKRYWMLEKRKPKNVALVAIAREFVGFIWSLMQKPCVV